MVEGGWIDLFYCIQNRERERREQTVGRFVLELKRTTVTTSCCCSTHFARQCRSVQLSFSCGSASGQSGRWCLFGPIETEPSS